MKASSHPHVRDLTRGDPDLTNTYDEASHKRSMYESRHPPIAAHAASFSAGYGT